MSVFAAVLPAAVQRDHLAAALAPLRPRWPALRWGAPERWHATVAFLGEVDDAALPGLAAALDASARPVPAPRLRLAGAGAFPEPPRRPAVVWVGVDGALAPLVAAAADAVARAGLRGDRRDHVPHLTVARTTTRRAAAAEAGAAVEALAGYAGPVVAAPVLHLLRSRPGRPGPYDVLAAVPLAPPG